MVTNGAANLERRMSSVQPQPVRKIRAIILSCHNQRYYESTIEPKLERYHVEAIRRIDPNRNNIIDFSDCDVGILLMELMPSHQVAIIRAQAKKQNKELITLHRQVSDWERAFARKEDQRIAGAVKPISARFDTEPRIPPKVTPPPAPSHFLPPPATKEPAPMWGKEAVSSSMPVLTSHEDNSESISSEYAQWLSMLEEDNTRQAAEIRRLNDAATRQASEFQELLNKNVKFDESNKSLMARVREAETKADNLLKEASISKSAHKKEVDEMKGLLRGASEELEKSGKGSVMSDIEKALKPFEELWKMGMMDAEEILKRLFKTKK